ncbi:MAG: hypothetical protein PHX18_08575 [Candidatus Gastranaerophilales bacterium]|nr:hypothetical protein [Candidatus Gastranaerophilales bacterium]
MTQINPVIFKQFNSYPAVSRNYAPVNVAPASYIPKQEVQENKKLKNYLLTGAAGLAIITAGVIIHKRNISKASEAAGAIINNAKEVVLKSSVKKVFEEQMANFADDITYRKSLMQEISAQAGLKVEDYAVLRSIIGKQELTAVVKGLDGNPACYKQGQRAQKWVQDSENFDNINNLLYRANLHMHTQASDGAMSVQKLLDDAAAYADKVAASNPSLVSNAPFTIAITDHDTTKGCIDALKIIAAAPEKYKNLRLVLGAELSTYHSNLPNVNENFSTHLLAYCVNPFKGDFASMVEQKQKNTINMARHIIAKMKDKFKDAWDFKEIDYNLDEAKTTSWCIKEGLNTIINPVKDYLQFRKIYHELVKYNEPLKEFLGKKLATQTLDFPSTASHVTFVHKNLMPNAPVPYWEKYIASIKMELLQRLHGKDMKINAENYKGLFKEVDDLFKPLNDSVKESLQSVENQVYQTGIKDSSLIFEFGKILEILKHDNDIIPAIAHPALRHKYDYTKEPTDSLIKETIENLFKFFKENAGDKTLFYEKNYPYFQGGAGNYVKVEDDLLDFIDKAAKRHSLLPSGSLDTHGKNIFLTE